MYLPDRISRMSKPRIKRFRLVLVFSDTKKNA
jgi:hypothetical protein